jgi:hypothetical protein
MGQPLTEWDAAPVEHYGATHGGSEPRFDRFRDCSHEEANRQARREVSAIDEKAVSAPHFRRAAVDSDAEDGSTRCSSESKINRHRGRISLARQCSSGPRRSALWRGPCSSPVRPTGAPMGSELWLGLKSGLIIRRTNSMLAQASSRLMVWQPITARHCNRKAAVNFSRATLLRRLCSAP